MNNDPTKNQLGDSSSDESYFDEAVFEAFFKKHFQPLCIYCKVKFGFDLFVAEDIVNNSFIKLWEVRDTLSSDLYAKAFLYKVIANNSFNVLKHEKVKRRHAQFILNNTAEGVSQNNLDLKQLRNDIDAAILQLPEQMRRIFELSRFESLKYSEIAAQLNISVKTVETQMSRALAKLREKLSGYLGCSLIILILGLLIKKSFLYL